VRICGHEPPLGQKDTEFVRSWIKDSLRIEPTEPDGLKSIGSPSNVMMDRPPAQALSRLKKAQVALL